MTDRTLRALLGAAAVSLVLGRLLYWLGELWGATAAMAGAGIAALVSMICARMARVGVGNVAWFLVPTLLFTIVPAAYKGWKFFMRETSIPDRMWELAPILLSFVIPLGIILLVYLQLRRRESG
ncbi:MAG TPA: hypothetical protein PLM79_12420 [Syntrophobacteraceae bacterium]|nr:hypothetical protein [Syntrophobacteraceae bacterium]